MLDVFKKLDENTSANPQTIKLLNHLIRFKK